ncbi:MAG: hypothetical protein RIR65_162 [Planctomycetota bacterium]
MAIQRDEWRRLALGLGAVAVVCAPVAWMSWREEGWLGASRVTAFFATTLAFTLVLAAQIARPAWSGRTHAPVAALSALALLANWLIPMVLTGVALTGILLVVAAVEFARLPRRVAVACMAAQTILLFAIYAGSHGWPFGIASLAASGYGLMQVVLESTARLAMLERARRVELEGAVRELRSTRAMLEETVRADQRSEIARELHDVLGHQLVALGLQLDAAGSPASADERARLAESRRLVAAALSSVRSVVAGLRDQEAVDLAAALKSLATEGPGPRVVVRVDGDAPRMTLDLAEALLRCAQEALTNARKHAEARVVEIGLDKERLVVRDDGRGMGGAEPGFGLQSMRARCEALGCELAIGSSPHGTQVAIRWASEGAS